MEVERWDNDPNEIFIQAYDSTAFGKQNENGTIFSKLYNENSRVYTTYLNENKTYEIKFGNGVLGKKLSPGDRVHVMYLDTNGPDGYIDMSQLPNLQISSAKLEHSPSFFGLDSTLYSKMFSTNDTSIENNASFTCDMQIDPNSLTHV